MNVAVSDDKDEDEGEDEDDAGASVYDDDDDKAKSIFRMFLLMQALEEKEEQKSRKETDNFVKRNIMQKTGKSTSTNQSQNFLALLKLPKSPQKTVNQRASDHRSKT